MPVAFILSVVVLTLIIESVQAYPYQRYMLRNWLFWVAIAVHFLVAWGLYEVCVSFLVPNIEWLKLLFEFPPVILGSIYAVLIHSKLMRVQTSGHPDSLNLWLGYFVGFLPGAAKNLCRLAKKDAIAKYVHTFSLQHTHHTANDVKEALKYALYENTGKEWIKEIIIKAYFAPQNVHPDRLKLIHLKLLAEAAVTKERAEEYLTNQPA